MALIDGNITYVISNPVIQDDASVSIVDYEAHVSDPCEKALANIEASGGDDFYNVYLKPSMTLVQTAVASPFQILEDRG